MRFSTRPYHEGPLLEQEIFEASWLIKSLLGLVGLGFLAWAGVVWRGVIAVKETASEIKSQLERISMRLEMQSERLQSHEKLPWHRNAGEEITRIGERLNHIERRVKE